MQKRINKKTTKIKGKYFSPFKFKFSKDKFKIKLEIISINNCQLLGKKDFSKISDDFF